MFGSKHYIERVVKNKMGTFVTVTNSGVSRRGGAEGAAAPPLPEIVKSFCRKRLLTTDITKICLFQLFVSQRK